MFFGSMIVTLGQDQTTDSLLSLLNNAPNDSVRLKTLIDLCDEKTYNQPDEAVNYFLQAEKLAKQTGDLLLLARSYERAGNIYTHTGDKRKAAQYYLKAEKINEEVGDYEISASVMYNLGNIHYEMGNFDSTIYYGNRAGEIFLANNDSIGYAASLYLSIGPYKDLGNYYQAMLNGLTALKIFQHYNLRTWEIYCLNNIVDLYNLQGKYEKSLEILREILAEYRKSNNLKFESVALRYIGDVYLALEDYEQSLDYLNEAIRISDENGFLPEKAKSLFSKANLFFEQEKYNESLNYFEQGLSVSRQISDKGFVAKNLIGIGKSLYKLSDYYSSTENLEKAYDLMTDMGDLESLKDIYQYKALNLEKQNNYKDALSAYRKYHFYSDSILKAENSRELIEVNAKYEFEKKEAQIAVLQSENKLFEANRKRVLFTWLLTLIIALLISLILFIRIRKNKQLLEKEKEVEKMKSRFFANISHEFRTPLTLILSPVYELIKKEELKAFKPDLEMIHKQARKLLGLINQILNLSRLDAGKYELVLENMDMTLFLRKVFLSFHSLAEQKNVELIYDGNDENFFTSFDADHMETIINNLVSNAIKHEPENGKISLRLSLNTNKNRIVIEVHNQGSFIPRDQQEYLFDRFYRTDLTPGESMSSGIGLSLAKELTELHHGEIYVRSDHSSGTSFFVEIPLNQNNYPGQPDHKLKTDIYRSLQKEIPQSSLQNSEIFESENKPRLLIIDDHKEIRDFLSSFLNKDYEVFTAFDGNDGLEKAFELIPDVIICDVMMPGKNGPQLSRMLKTDIRTSHIPIILLTARASDESKMEGLGSMADDYLTKPFNNDELQLRIKNLVENRTLLRLKYSADQIYKSKDANISSVDVKFLEKVVNAVETNISNEEFSVEELSKLAGMSRSQLHRKLIALVNQSASQFIRNYRLRRAKELLENNAGTVAEIGYMVGFSSPVYFNKSFRDLFNITPGEARKQ